MAKGIFTKSELKEMIGKYRMKLEAKKIKVKKIYLYGSYCKGKANKNSDIDVCIISPDFQDQIEGTMTLMKLRNENELYISPVAFLPEEFVDENPLAWEVKRTGREV